MKTKPVCAIFLSLLALLAGCGKQQDVSYIATGKEEIRVGVLLPLTGSGQATGVSLQASLELACGDINGWLSGIDVAAPVKLLVMNSRTDTAYAMAAMRELHDNGIRFVIGPYSSAELSAIRQFANDHGMIVISPSSVAVSLAIPGDNIYRFVSSDLVQGKAMAKYLSEDKVRVVLPIIRDDVWGNDLLNATSLEFKKAGGLVNTPVRYNPVTSDFTGILLQAEEAVAGLMKQYPADDIAVYSLNFSEGISILKASSGYQNLNNVYWYGSSALAKNPGVTGDTVAARFAFTHGFPCPVFGLDDQARYLWEPLRERIVEKTGYQPDVYAFAAYDALWVLVKACLVAGKNSPVASLKSALEQEAGSYFGVTGSTRLDVNGDRAAGNYDFWSVKSDSSGYCWKLTARYNYLDGTITRFKP